MKLFRKSDEMEMHITWKATRLSYAFLCLSLAIWLLVEIIRTGQLLTIPFLLTAGSGALFWGSQLYFRYRMGRQEDEK